MLFHTGFPFASEIAQIMSATRRRVIFRNVDREFASFPNGFDPYTNEPTFWKRGKWNYHHMIRFWFKLIFDIEEMKNFDYVMRLDTDSRLIGKWANVFDLMKVKDIVYIANDEQIEFEKVLPGTLELQTFFTDYTTKKKLIPQDPSKISAAFMKNGIRTYYNNFELFRTTFFRQAIVQDWINAVDASHGIYKYRWGDAILRYLTLALFAKDHQVIHRNQLNLPYCHPC